MTHKKNSTQVQQHRVPTSSNNSLNVNTVLQNIIYG